MVAQQVRLAGLLAFGLSSIPSIIAITLIPGGGFPKLSSVPLILHYSGGIPLHVNDTEDMVLFGT